MLDSITMSIASMIAAATIEEPGYNPTGPSPQEPCCKLSGENFHSRFKHLPPYLRNDKAIMYLNTMSRLLVSLDDPTSRGKIPHTTPDSLVIVNAGVTGQDCAG